MLVWERSARRRVFACRKAKVRDEGVILSRSGLADATGGAEDATYECKKSCRDTALRVGSGSSGVCVGSRGRPELIREMFPSGTRLGAQIGDRGGFATPGHDPIR